jgi:6-pyruvoyltetrahydropterin/6-carboxytetrahydropterin synthase
MFKIQKHFKFDMGHRIPTQKLDEKLALTTENKCKRLHGHEYFVDVSLSGQRLRIDGMLLDFNHLNFFKQMINSTLDHKFMIWIDDPVFEKLIRSFDLDKIENISLLSIINGVTSSIDKNNIISNIKDVIVGEIDSYKMTITTTDEDLREYYNSFVVSSFIPTAEGLSRFFYNYLMLNLKNLATVDLVTVHETSTSMASYNSSR